MGRAFVPMEAITICARNVVGRAFVSMGPININARNVMGRVFVSTECDGEGIC